jgi:hypothetical protein
MSGQYQHDHDEELGLYWYAHGNRFVGLTAGTTAAGRLEELARLLLMNSFGVAFAPKKLVYSETVSGVMSRDDIAWVANMEIPAGTCRAHPTKADSPRSTLSEDARDVVWLIEELLGSERPRIAVKSNGARRETSRSSTSCCKLVPTTARRSVKDSSAVRATTTRLYLVSTLPVEVSRAHGLPGFGARDGTADFEWREIDGS